MPKSTVILSSFTVSDLSSQHECSLNKSPADPHDLRLTEVELSSSEDTLLGLERPCELSSTRPFHHSKIPRLNRLNQRVLGWS